MSEQLTIRVPITSIERNPLNPTTRTADNELIESIREYGILTPLIVKKNGAVNKYVVIAGERRLHAARHLKMTDVPVIINDATGSRADAILLVDNIHRRQMNMYEEYLVINELLKSNPIATVASMLKKGTNFVVRRMNLANLIPAIVKGINEGYAGLTERMVYLLVNAPADIQKDVFHRMTEDVTIGDKKTKTIVWSESRLEDVIKEEIKGAFLGGKLSTESAIRLFGDKVGNVAIDKALDASLSESNALLPSKTITDKESLERAKQMKETLKRLGQATKLSNTVSYNSDILGASQWRKATEEDDEKTVLEGVLINGPSAGKLVLYVKVKEKEAKDEKKPKTEKQIEAERKERREKRLANNIERRFSKNVFDALFIKNLKNVLPAEAVEFVVDNLLQHSYLTAILRQSMTKEEYGDISMESIRKHALKHLSDMDPANAILALLFSRGVVFHSDAIGKLLGLDPKALRAKHKEAILEEEKKEQQAKEAERIKKQSDAAAKAKQKK